MSCAVMHLLVAGPAHAALQHRLHAELCGDIAYVDLLIAERERRRARRNLETGHPVEGVRQFFGKPIRKILFVGIAASESQTRTGRLHQNVPNPFNPRTTISFDTASDDGDVRLIILDPAGRYIRTLVDGIYPAGAHQVEWVLGCNDEKRLREHVRRTFDGDLALGHGFQQCALGFRSRAVDLVGQHQLGKNRSLVKFELFQVTSVYRDTQDVGGQQVRGELDALIAGPDHGCERMG